MASAPTALEMLLLKGRDARLHLGAFRPTAHLRDFFSRRKFVVKMLKIEITALFIQSIGIEFG
jgi:hypothetical protein